MLHVHVYRYRGTRVRTRVPALEYTGSSVHVSTGSMLRHIYQYCNTSSIVNSSMLLWLSQRLRETREHQRAWRKRFQINFWYSYCKMSGTPVDHSRSLSATIPWQHITCRHGHPKLPVLPVVHVYIVHTSLLLKLSVHSSIWHRGLSLARGCTRVHIAILKDSMRTRVVASTRVWLPQST